MLIFWAETSSIKLPENRAKRRRQHNNTEGLSPFYLSFLKAHDVLQLSVFTRASRQTPTDANKAVCGNP
jgi:hypothetical protein